MNSVEESISTLREAVDLGEPIGAQVDQARETLELAEKRSGFGGETYVMALLGGTGVGKSTLLNAIAGMEVAKASVLRPTTRMPTAWVAESAKQDVLPLLGWLEIERIVTHQDASLRNVAIVDLPDFDSIAYEHRELTDRLIPKLDVLVWVVDPEKYDDERLFEYLRVVGPALPEVRLILNKTDQLEETEVVSVVADLKGRLAQAGLSKVSVTVASAMIGEGVDELRETIRAQADAKRAIADAIRYEAALRIKEIGADVAVIPGRGFEPLLADGDLDRYTEEAIDSALEMVDLQGLSAQVRKSYREQFNLVAGSVLGRLVSLFRLASGNRRRTANPKSYLLNWRARGDLGRVVNPVRTAYLKATESLGPDARAVVLGNHQPDDVRRSIEVAIDRATTQTAKHLEDPKSRLLMILAPLQWVATVGFLAGLAWYLLIILGPGDLAVGTMDVPILGPVPTPLLLMLASLVLSFVVGLLAGLTASVISARRARLVKQALKDELGETLQRHAFQPLNDLDSKRRRLGEILARSKVG